MQNKILFNNFVKDPTILDELDHLYKSDVAKKLLFYFQTPEQSSNNFSATALTQDSEDKGSLNTF